MAKIPLTSLLKAMVDQGASDLHFSTGVPPELRIGGRMVKVKMDVLTSQDIVDMIHPILTPDQKKELETELELDFSFGVKDVARFRGNLFYQRGSLGAVFRMIPFQLPDFDQMGLPPILKKLIRNPSGLVLVTGPTGSGKTTTLAAMLDLLNREEYGHLITIEDPIEFLYPHRNCIVNQREVGSDTKSFHAAMKRLLRQDPDFILVGELRDAESIEMALTMAETGHLVFATLHTNGAVQSISRLIGVFPPHQQNQIRQLLAQTLQAVLSQQLISKVSGAGCAMALELLIPNVAIRNLIREDKIHQIYSMMQSGQESSGMQTLNQSLAQLVRQGVISKGDALAHSTTPEELSKMLMAIADRKAG